MTLIAVTILVLVCQGLGDKAAIVMIVSGMKDVT